MTYVLLIYAGDAPTPRKPEAWARLTDDERDAIAAGYRAIHKTPGVRPGIVLEPPERFVSTVRVAGDEVTTSGEPYGPDGAVLDSFFMLDTDDPDEAIAVASRIPMARLGGAIEVRRVIERGPTHTQSIQTA